MKKILCFIMVLLMLVSVVSCGNANEPQSSGEGETTQMLEGDSTTDGTEASEEESTEAPDLTGEETTEPAEPQYDGIFRTGYSRAVITPNVGFPIEDFTKVENDLCATCVAVFDGDSTVILISIDLHSITESQCDGIRNRIKNVTGVPTENVFISADRKSVV